MKKILITGAHSYIGTSVEKWLSHWSEEYMIDTISVRGSEWKKKNFSEYDVVFHVAGIAHRKNVPDSLFEAVNHMLAVEVAKRANDAGVNQFILMSSGAVYSQSDKRHKAIKVSNQTQCEPCTAYGISKLRADQDILYKLNHGKTKVVILRPPMVYGPGAKGNYNMLRKIACRCSIFPKIDNKRSMIYIDNLCEFIRLIIDNNSEGIFLPQNGEYVVTYRLVEEIAHNVNRKIKVTDLINWIVYLSSYFFNPINKAFGTYIYEADNYFSGKYQIVDFVESIKQTEKQGKKLYER